MVWSKIKARMTMDRIGTLTERVLQGMLAVILLWVAYRHSWIDSSDPFKCGALLHQGEWLDPDSTRDPFQNWQPPGCLMHKYNKRDIHECLHNRRLVFIGDSTTRQIFWAIAKKMDRVKAEEDIANMLARKEKHTDLIFEVYGVKIQFIWDPWLNSTSLDRELKKFSAVSSLESCGVSDESAAVVLLGAPGLWNARYNHENYMKDFKDTVERIIPYLDHGGGGERNLHSTSNTPQIPSNLLLMAPVQVPHYEFLSPSRAAMITPRKIQQMNDFLQQASAKSDADIIWSYNLMTWGSRAQYEESGLHTVENIAHRKVDVLLNLRCNAGPASNKYPFDRTCCSKYTHPNHIQWIMIFAGMLVFSTIFSLRTAHVWLRGYLPSVQTLTACSIFSLVICFSHCADRTQIFEKSQKQFRQGELGTACFAVGIAGLISMREAKGAIGLHEQYFLSRSQSDEWKGWMQFFVLIYHYTHGSSVLWIYEIVRLLIASYLFMTGYGHAMYFLKTADYSFKRVVGVLIRLNLLSCVLPYMMRTDYMFYYFSALASFWFLIIYATLAIGHERNCDLSFLFTKIVLAATLVTCFVRVHNILEFILLVLRKTSGISWNVAELRFRISLDLYIVYVGMFLAAVVIRRTKLESGTATSNSLADSCIDRAIQLSVTHQTKLNANIALVSVWSLICFWVLIHRHFSRKEDYNRWQPYISFIPVLSYVGLRNCCGFLRKYHSAAFAWLGRCSLETYILQYHIWLAGDTRGLLSLGLGSRFVDALVLTPIFLWISWHTANAIQVLTNVITGGTKCREVRSKEGAIASGDLPCLASRLEDACLVQDHSHINSTEPNKQPVKRVNDLRWRICVVLLLMWLANVTYQ